MPFCFVLKKLSSAITNRKREGTIGLEALMAPLVAPACQQVLFVCDITPHTASAPIVPRRKLIQPYLIMYGPDAPFYIISPTGIEQPQTRALYVTVHSGAL